MTIFGVKINSLKYHAKKIIAFWPSQWMSSPKHDYESPTWLLYSVGGFTIGFNTKDNTKSNNHIAQEQILEPE
jgi:hypothetical protein